MEANIVPIGMRSLSARRAWIEISSVWCTCLSAPVALRKESVDRNRDKHEHQTDIILSLSARRAWIEMLLVM